MQEVLTGYNQLFTDEQFDQLFDRDLRGLSKSVQAASVMDLRVRYLKPSLPQIARILNFLVQAVHPLIPADFEPEASEEEKAGLKNLSPKAVKFVQVIAYIAYLNETFSGDSPQQQQFSNALAIDPLFETAVVKTIDECFPDLNPYYLTNEALFECIGTIINDTIIF